MKRLRKIIRYFINVVIVLFITLLGFELCYRFSVIDFYASEKNGLNTSVDLKNDSIDVLVFGDSFSATAPEINYLDKIRNQNKKRSIINLSIPGTGIKQANTFAKKQIKKYNPKVVIYQVYVGNDLLDVNHLFDLENVSILRNLYWELSDHFLSLSYLNHKATVFKPRINSRAVTMPMKDFSKQFYNDKTKLLFNIDASYVEKAVSLTENFSKRYTAWVSEMEDFLNVIPEETKVYIVWIPNCAQVNDYYLQNMETLGANFNSKESFKQENYSFYFQATQDLSLFKNVKHLNVLPQLRMKDHIDYRTYFANDPHINNNGNVVLSNYLLSSIPELLN
ncbi:SGNH/GDSL hydrolase family protein [Lacinutrix jangbogonensis]|uniref:SGNH/GDSL hydrolase family protein n=1 Tax=Lacinutrix jangbogonensis TaxID=1469557 RepID=UPI000AF5E8E9|nr:SGNH/GDSL hydrolase family protein [Lacinutrix jangbogonensis]